MGEQQNSTEVLGRLVKIETQIEQLRLDLARYFAELDRQEERIRQVEQAAVKNCQRVDNLERRVNGWGLSNSAGALIATVIAWFK